MLKRAFVRSPGVGPGCVRLLVCALVRAFVCGLFSTALAVAG